MLPFPGWQIWRSSSSNTLKANLRGLLLVFQPGSSGELLQTTTTTASQDLRVPEAKLAKRSLVKLVDERKLRLAKQRVKWWDSFGWCGLMFILFFFLSNNLLRIIHSQNHMVRSHPKKFPAPHYIKFTLPQLFSKNSGEIPARKIENVFTNKL